MGLAWPLSPHEPRLALLLIYSHAFPGRAALSLPAGALAPWGLGNEASLTPRSKASSAPLAKPRALCRDGKKKVTTGEPLIDN